MDPLRSSNIEKTFNEALAALNGQNLFAAERLFREVLKTVPKHVPSLNLLSIVLMSMDRCGEAEKCISKAVKLDQSSDVAFYNFGLIYKRLNKHDLALVQFSRALELNGKVAETWNNRGTTFNDLKNYEAAISDFDQAIRLQPSYLEAYANKGKSLLKLKRYDDALAAYGKGLALKPDFAEAWLGHGNALFELKRYGEALAAFDQAIAARPDFAEAWLGRGNVFIERKRYDEAFAAFDKALAIKPELPEAWLGRGNGLFELKRHDEALAAFEKALTIEPDLVGAWLGRGNVFVEQKRHDEAFAAFDRALGVKPDLAEAWLGLGNGLLSLRRRDEAFAAYDRALALKADLVPAWIARGTLLASAGDHDKAFVAFDRARALEPNRAFIEGQRLHSKMRLCDWNNLAAEREHLKLSVENGIAQEPFVLLSVSSSAAEQLQCAKLRNAANCPVAGQSVWRGEHFKHDRIRVAYLSADFRDHPVSYLLSGVLEHHDKSHFEVTGISFGLDENSAIRQRIKGAFEHFIDVQWESDESIARLVHQHEIDIAIDLMGFTGNNRANVLARRPAPVQVSYLGYAGTMGADYIDYILADSTVVPRDQFECYGEKIVWLPGSFIPNDSSRRVSEGRPSRSECSLPEDAFVFCCFSNSYKLNPEIFRIWMRLLKAAPNSVLWLSRQGAIAATNLRREAEANGVSLDRLIFAAKVPSVADHLARHHLADLFLDTLPYNAHSTGCDALWTGLPVLTQIGETFAGRVAASLLNAIGLPDLIAHSHEEYENMALELVNNTAKLSEVKQRLKGNRLTAPLFDTQSFTRNLEVAYEKMYARHHSGLRPDHFAVAQN